MGLTALALVSRPLRVDLLLELPLVVLSLAVGLLGIVASDSAHHVVHLAAYAVNGPLCVALGLGCFLLGYSFIVLDKWALSGLLSKEIVERPLRCCCRWFACLYRGQDRRRSRRAAEQIRLPGCTD